MNDTEKKEYSLREQITEVVREIAVRMTVYPRWVESKKLSQAKADDQIAKMQAVRFMLEGLEAKADRYGHPDFFTQFCADPIDGHGDGWFSPLDEAVEKALKASAGNDQVWRIRQMGKLVDGERFDRLIALVWCQRVFWLLT